MWWMISCVVCHGSNKGCWSDRCQEVLLWGHVCNMIGNDFCVNYYDCYFDIYMRVWLQSWPAIPVPVLVVVSRGQSGVMLCVSSPGVCRCAWWWYSIWTIFCYVTILIALKTMHMLGQLHAMWPDSWHWKHWSPSLVITLTVEEGNRVAVNYCAAWSFTTALMASVSSLRFLFINASC